MLAPQVYRADQRNTVADGVVWYVAVVPSAVASLVGCFALAYEFRTNFPVRLENPHVINPDQVRRVHRLLGAPHSPTRLLWLAPPGLHQRTQQRPDR